MTGPPYEDAPENHWSRWIDPEDEHYVPPQKCFPVPCPPFEDVALRVVELRTSSPRVTGFAEPHGFEDEGDDEYDDDGVDNLT